MYLQYLLSLAACLGTFPGLTAWLGAHWPHSMFRYSPASQHAQVSSQPLSMVRQSPASQHDQVPPGLIACLGTPRPHSMLRYPPASQHGQVTPGLTAWLGNPRPHSMLRYIPSLTAWLGTPRPHSMDTGQVTYQPHRMLRYGNLGQHCQTRVFCSHFPFYKMLFLNKLKFSCFPDFFVRIFNTRVEYGFL